ATSQREQAELEQAHELTVVALKAEHEQEVALMAERARLAADTHHQALAEQQAKYDGQLADAQATAAREIAELRGQLQAAKRAAEAAEARHEAQAAEAGRMHAAAL